MTANVLEHRRARAFADAVEDRPGTAVPIGAPHQEPAVLFMVIERFRDRDPRPIYRHLAEHGR